MSASKYLKRVASRLPRRVQSELKRWQYSREIRTGRFFTDEQEYQLLSQWVSEGDWVLDVGANIGHYAFRLSELVGERGRVIAFEPVPATFELLASNIARLPSKNVTLMNVAASSEVSLAGMSIPMFDTGLDNYYMAHLSGNHSALEVLTLPIDYLNIPTRISLVKIDAEGHDIEVVRGMKNLIDRDRPVLIIESDDPELAAMLGKIGYSSSRLDGSSNTVYQMSSLEDDRLR